MEKKNKLFWAVTVLLIAGIGANIYYAVKNQAFSFLREKETFYPNEYVGVFADMAEIVDIGGYEEEGGISIIDAKPFITEIEKLPADITENDEVNGKVLIYHTHTNEAYLKNEQERIQQLYASRTNDSEYTVVKTGNTLTDALEKYGISVDHDTSNNEENGYNRAYATSMSNITSMTKENGKYSLYIDLHRDSYTKNVDSTVTIDGVKVAKVMFVVGTQAPDYKNNLALAEKMMELLNEIHPQLCERVLEVDTNYNQNISDHALLIEVGDNAVTAEEASRAAEYVAQALAELHGVMW